MPRLKLTAENYYSHEANIEYMSASQFKAFARCEAAALAELRGEWGRKETTALLVGSYVDAYFSGELEQFKADHPEIYTKQNTLRSDFEKANAICERLERDELSRMLLSGKHQTIKTGEIGGVWFKMKSDSLLSAAQVEEICKKFPSIRQLVPFGGSIIVDLKIMKDFADIWDDELREYVNFVEFWGYDIQGAIYQKIDDNDAPFVIVTATKEPEPDIAALHITDEELAFALSDVEMNAPRYAAIKRGEIEPVSCGKCVYCRRMKRLTGVRHYMTINEIEERKDFNA